MINGESIILVVIGSVRISSIVNRQYLWNGNEPKSLSQYLHYTRNKLMQAIRWQKNRNAPWLLGCNLTLIFRFPLIELLRKIFFPSNE